MIPGCTHALDLELDDESIDLGGYDVYVTIKQLALTLDLSGDRVEVDGNRATVYLTQEESLQLKDRQPMTVQLNWTSQAVTGEVSRGASDPAVVPVGMQLLRRILP